MFQCVTRVQDIPTFCLRDLLLIILRTVHRGSEHLSGWHVILTQTDSEKGALGPKPSTASGNRVLTSILSKNRKWPIIRTTTPLPLNTQRSKIKTYCLTIVMTR